MKRLHPRAIDLSLHRIERLLAALERPETRLPPVVHVAGTNGKGSTIAFLRAALEAAGYRVHAYTSPHLVRFNERIVLAGKVIGDDALADILEECAARNAEAPVTYFEITTAAAFLAFARVPADILLMETGLGGRLDATNVVAAPRLTVITPVSPDHQQHLGTSVEEIAGEKAGILKPGVPAVIGPQPPEAQRVLEGRARALGAPLYRHGTDWNAAARADGMDYRGRRHRPGLPRPGLEGPHQVENAGLAVACLDMLSDFAVDDDALARGLAAPVWPGRLQRLRAGPLVAALPEGWELWLDGAHNEAAARALARVAKEWRDRPLHLVVAMVASKDPAAFFGPLAPHVATVTAVPGPGEHEMIPPRTVAVCARRAGINASSADNVEAALAGLTAGAERAGRVLICGSLYLVGAVLESNG